MPHRINEDHKRFRDVISGRSRKELKRLIKSGSIVRQRPKGGKMTISIPQIDIPHFLFGDSDKGVGRGPGKPDDVIGKDPGQGKGGQAGTDPGEGIRISVDMADVLRFLEEELHLPKMKPKPNQTFEEVKIKYNDISKNGPESLRHTRRTMKEALKRMAMCGELEQPTLAKGSVAPVRMITPINSDRRYRQYREIKIPSSNAVIFFARDCSGSMDDYRCDIVSDMAWWLDCWIRKFYKRVDRCYFVHDTLAQEVNEEEFYTYRYGGGTQCSSAFKAIAEQLENRYPPHAYNIYVFYFSDGDNQHGDNERMVKIIKEELGADKVNLIGMSQICAWRYDESVKCYFDECIKDGRLGSNVRTTSVGEKTDGDKDFGFGNWGYKSDMTEEQRNTQIIEGIKKLLGKEQVEDE